MVRARGVARKSFARRRVRRVKKYDSHVTPLRYKKYLPDMAELLKPPLDIHVECEVPCMELLETLGVPLSEYPYYLGFMKRMIVLYRKFTSETLASEKESLISEYVLRGKDEDVLEEVQEVAALCAGGIFEMDLWTRDFYKMIQFQSVDGFGFSTNDTGSYSISEGLVNLATGANVGSWSYMEDKIDHPLVDLGTLFTWDKQRRMRVGVYFGNDTNQLIYIISGSIAAPPGYLIGFKIVDNQIFGVVCDGVSETLTAALRTLTAGEEFILEARYVPDVECRFYIDNVEVAVLTTGFPSGLNYAAHLVSAYIENTADEDKSIEFDLWEFYQKR